MSLPRLPEAIAAGATAHRLREYSEAVAAQHAAAVALFRANPAHPAFDPTHVRVGVDCVSDNVGVLMDILVATGLVTESTLIEKLIERVDARTARLRELVRETIPESAMAPALGVSPAADAALLAARAEEMAVVYRKHGSGQLFLDLAAALRAADERFQIIRALLERVDARAMASDGPVAKTREEMTDIEFRRLYVVAGGA